LITIVFRRRLHRQMAGFSPLRMRLAYCPQTVCPRDMGRNSLATTVGISSPWITCGERMACSERYELSTSAREERIGTDQERRPAAGQRR
jgi:hypothetical protein